MKQNENILYFIQYLIAAYINDDKDKEGNENFCVLSLWQCLLLMPDNCRKYYSDQSLKQ